MTAPPLIADVRRHERCRIEGHSDMSLWRRSRSRASGTADAHEVQLFNLWPLRRALGLFQRQLGPHRDLTRRALEVLVEA